MVTLSLIVDGFCCLGSIWWHECKHFVWDISHRSNLWLFGKANLARGILMKLCRIIPLTNVSRIFLIYKRHYCQWFDLPVIFGDKNCLCGLVNNPVLKLPDQRFDGAV